MKQGNRDEWRGVGDVMEIETDLDGEGIAEKRSHGTDFVRDTLVI